MNSEIILEEISDYLCSLKEGLSSHSTLKATDYFDLESFLLGFNVKNCTHVEYKVIDRLCKKIDVANKLKRNYQADLSLPYDEEVLNVSFIELYVLNLIHLTITRNDFKFLNTLLKVQANVLPGFSLNNVIDDFIEEAVLALMGKKSQP